MKTITFVTSNKAKFEWAKRRLTKLGIKLLWKKLEVPEPREFGVEKVAEEKAKSVMKFVKRSFIVDDSGFLIKCLNNFPGTYLKLVLKTISVEGLCKLAKGCKDRTTNFKSVLAYVDARRKIHLFVCNDVGKLPPKPKGNRRRDWSDFMKIHIPKGFNKTLAEMSDEEFKKYEEGIEAEDHYVKFAKYLRRK